MPFQDSRARAFLGRNAVWCLAIAAVVIIALRRPGQFLHPTGWAESVAQTLPAIAQDGFLAIFTPVNGYMIVISKLIDYIAVKTSLYFYPEISAFLAIALIVGTAVLICKAPTAIPGKFLLALLTLLVPVNPEMFSVSLYAFWWSAIWLLLLAAWTETPTRRQAAGALALGVIASLSSPFGLLFSPVFALRFLLHRSGFNFLLAASIALPAALQAFLIITAEPIGGTTPYSPGIGSAVVSYGLVMGYFAGYAPNPGGLNQFHIMLYGLAISVIAFLFALKFRAALGRHFFLLMAAYILAVASIALRVDPTLTNPVSDGPRYFFIPFVILSALFVWLFCAMGRKYVIGGTVVLALLWMNQLPASFWRTHDALSWRPEVATCLNGHQAELPAHWDGTLQLHWIGRMPQGCGRLGSWIDRIAIARHDTPVFTQELFSGRPLATARLISNEGWREGGFFDPAVVGLLPPGAVSLGSHVNGDAFTGSVTLEVQPGEDGAALFVRTGPSPSALDIQILQEDGEWSAPLTVRPQVEWWIQIAVPGSAQRPVQVRLTDPGGAWGQWAGVAYIPLAGEAAPEP